MPTFINGIEQIPAEERKLLTVILRRSNYSFWIAIASLIVATAAIIAAILCQIGCLKGLRPLKTQHIPSPLRERRIKGVR